MYKVPLIINQRDVIIALHPSDLPTKNVAIDTFVVDNTELLRFYKKILALDYDGPLSNDYILNISAISRKEDAITVEFTTFKQGGIAYSQDGLELTNDHYCYLRLKQFPNEATPFPSEHTEFGSLLLPELDGQRGADVGLSGNEKV